MTQRKDVVTFNDLMENLDQIPKGDPFARGNAPVDPLRAQSMANALRMQTRRPADDLRRQIEAIDSMPWKELRDSLRLALVELAEVKPALHDALCERDELETECTALRALLVDAHRELATIEAITVSPSGVDGLIELVNRIGQKLESSK
jgi:hypothetical protein